MKMTSEQLETAARTYCEMINGSDDDWEDVADGELWTLTRDSLADFVRASSSWTEASSREDGDGFAYWESMQARRGETRESLVVVDCGEFRACMK